MSNQYDRMRERILAAIAKADSAAILNGDEVIIPGKAIFRLYRRVPVPISSSS